MQTANCYSIQFGHSNYASTLTWCGKSGDLIADKAGDADPLSAPGSGMKGFSFFASVGAFMHLLIKRKAAFPVPGASSNLQPQLNI